MTQTPATTSMPVESAASPQVLYARLRWLLNVRWGYAAMFLLLSIVSSRGLPHIGDPLLGIAGACTVYNLFWELFSLTTRKNRPGLLLSSLRIQLIADMVAWILAMEFTGGLLNVLLPGLVFHMAIGASLLTLWEGMALAGVTILALWIAVVAEYPNSYGPTKLGRSVTDRSFPEFLIGAGSVRLEPAPRRVSATDFFSDPAVICIGTLVPAILVGTVYFVNALLTRLRRINTRLVDANRRLEGLDLAKSRFLRVSAHQLRSPLAAIHTMLSAIQEAGGLNVQQYAIARKIQIKSEDAMTLVDEMMLLSTIQEATAECKDLRIADLDAAVRAEAAAFESEAKAKNLAVTVAAESGATVAAFEDALETVLEHLLSNAIKYTPDGGSVSVSTHAEGAQVELKVADSGIGIPSNQQDRLFHEFFRATNARQVAGGTGMGLAIVAAIVERLSGTVEVESAEGKGTTFTVVLPITKTLTAENAENAEKAKREKKRTSERTTGSAMIVTVQ